MSYLNYCDNITVATTSQASAIFDNGYMKLAYKKV